MQRSSSSTNVGRELVAVGPVGRRGGRFDRDAIRRARRRTQHAGHALHAALLVAIEPMHAAIVQRQVRLHLGILLRDRLVIA